MPAPPASQVPEMSRFGAAGALVLGASSALCGNPPLFQSCARAALDHAHVAVTTTPTKMMRLTELRTIAAWAPAPGRPR